MIIILLLGIILFLISYQFKNLKAECGKYQIGKPYNEYKYLIFSVIKRSWVWFGKTLYKAIRLEKDIALHS